VSTGGGGGEGEEEEQEGGGEEEDYIYFTDFSSRIRYAKNFQLEIQACYISSSKRGIASPKFVHSNKRKYVSLHKTSGCFGYRNSIMQADDSTMLASVLSYIVPRSKRK
jgi:hypothetical protein